jgi:phosphoribosylanthranilate isomerase
MTWIKICGITNLEDALSAVDAGAHAIGFVFYEKSPRWIEPANAREIVAQLPNGVEKVGVFVDLAQDRLADIVNAVGLTGVQCRLRPRTDALAGEKPGFQRPTRMLLPLSATRLIEDEKRLQGLTSEFLRMAESRKPKSGFDTFVLDSTTPSQPGGTGRAFDWQRIAPLVHVMNRSVKVIVAGGLTADNVAEAMQILRPWGVDVSTGVEAAPGRKDPAKVKAFIQAVKNADKN